MSHDQAADAVARVRGVATLLPGVEEQMRDGETVFSVEQAVFAKVNGRSSLRVRAPADDADNADWITIDLSNSADCTLVEDAIARSWELSAPSRLLESGGR